MLDIYLDTKKIILKKSASVSLQISTTNKCPVLSIFSKVFVPFIIGT